MGKTSECLYLVYCTLIDLSELKHLTLVEDFFGSVSFMLKTKYHGFIFRVCYVSVPS